MSLGPTTVTLMLGTGVAVPAPADLTNSLLSVQVTESEFDSGFQLTFDAEPGTGGTAAALLNAVLLKPFSRVVVTASLNGVPFVLVDGLITYQELTPSTGTQPSTLTVTGRDVSVAMDLHETSTEWPAMDPELIVAAIVAEYFVYGMVPTIIPTDLAIPPLPIDRVPIQEGTDLGYLRDLASMFGYVFYVRPGPVPLTNIAYWGPPIRIGVPQPALSVNMDTATNVTSISFGYDAMAATTVYGEVLDMTTNLTVPVEGMPLFRLPPLASMPSVVTNLPYTRKTLFQHQGLNVAQAETLAEAISSYSTDAVVTVNGELDAFRYGSVLTARGLVGVRGAGYGYDGLYYIRSVTHNISYGAWTQSFELVREGLGSTVPVVPT